jgi:YD repeat-containing protein
MKKLTFLPTIILAALMMSCGGDDEETFVMPQTFLIAHKEDSSNGVVYESTDYQYDASNHLISEVNTSETITYTWSNAGKIVKRSATNGTYVRETLYQYNGDGNVIESQIINTTAGNVSEGRSTYAYFSDRCEERYYNASGENVWKYEHYYSVDKKNVTMTKTYYGTGDFYGSDIFEFDNKQGVQSVMPFGSMPSPYHNANNIVGVTQRNSDNQIVSTAAATYTFNQSGYPTGYTAGSSAMALEYIVK